MHARTHACARARAHTHTYHLLHLSQQRAGEFQYTSLGMYPVSYCSGTSFFMLSFQKSHICAFAMSHTRSKQYSLMDLC